LNVALRQAAHGAAAPFRTTTTLTIAIAIFVAAFRSTLAARAAAVLAIGIGATFATRTALSIRPAAAFPIAAFIGILCRPAFKKVSHAPSHLIEPLAHLLAHGVAFLVVQLAVAVFIESTEDSLPGRCARAVAVIRLVIGRLCQCRQCQQTHENQ
jgi:hypothetical protein